MEIDDLYQQILLDHAKKPRNRGAIEDPDGRAEGENPSCGDEISVTVRLDGPQIADVRFQGQGCAISQASASLMTLAVKGKPAADALAMAAELQHLITDADGPDFPKHFGQVRALEGVRKFPQRVKCATLAWQALRQALGQSTPGHTED